MLEAFGFHADFPIINLVLPVGISFYTFQALSYSIDVYRGNLNATRDIVAFFAYISFFPQLVAGPIERATNLLPQMTQKRYFVYGDAVDGMRQMLWGFFKKMVVADNCAMVVDEVWANYSSFSGFVLCLVAILFAFQIYCDFSGYSDIAIGCAKLFGIKLMQNFNHPYFSRNVREFWNRWHISLMSWFRDYIYFPLGGSRCSKWKTIRNTIIIFIVNGLWHGANWTFILWGIYHALLFLPLIIWKRAKYKNAATAGENASSAKEVMKIGLTFLLVMFGWVLFRSPSVGDAYLYVSKIFSLTFFDVSIIGKRCFLYITILCVCEWFRRGHPYVLDELEKIAFFKVRTIRWALYLCLFGLTMLLAGGQSDFIYFQF
ncbi:MBOAT family O-acyltransferase [uncultured Bacteroides sp.]|uniref:MBOAT family O-acyltransferase n=1 Tax=uncultured Bacteroides sp. TaxID=162156 RepID=UPI00262E6831|nr:MBOAT family O-acyltransferase [uncultured Bacteroides sp.]